MKVCALVAAAVLWAGSGLAWAEWPGFMGPGGLGVAAGEKVSKDWSTPPKQLWKVDVGEGYAGAAIVGGKVYLLDRTKNSDETFRVLDLNTGAEEWSEKYTAGPYLGGSYPGSRGTPCIDGDMAYTIGVTGAVYAWDLKTKKPVWNKSLAKDFGAQPGPWGFAPSPVVLRDMVFIDTPGSSKSGVVALNKTTGEVMWKSAAIGEKGGKDSYATPVVATIAGVEQLVVWHKGAVVGVDAKDGKNLWTFEWKTDRPIPNPVVLPGDKIFLTIGYGGGCSLLQIEKSGEGLVAKAIFKGDKKSASRVPPAIFYDGYIYSSCNDSGKGLQCLDVDGNVKWTGTGKFGLGSMLIADGVIFVINGNNGGLTMVAAKPDEYKELGAFKPLGGKDVWAPLAISNGKLVIRDQSQMICLDVGAK